MSDVILYHYHEISKEYTGTTKARLSPLDLKQGRIYYLKPPCTTEKPAPLDTKPPGGWVLMYFDVSKEVWRLKNHADAIRTAQEQPSVKQMLNELGFLLVETKQDSENKGKWYVLYWNGTPGYYALVHSRDRSWDNERYDSYQEAKYEIEVIEGRAQDVNLDTPITEEENKNSQERWNFYEQETRAEILANIEKQESDFETKLQTDLAQEETKANEYLTQMTGLMLQDQQEMQEILKQKAAFQLAVLRGKVAQVMQNFVASRKG